MTPQEQQMLQGLTDRINQTQLADKDPEAEQFIDQSLGKNADALYIMAQTVLVQQYALDQAKKQLDDLKQQLDQAKQQPVKHTSFLGSLLGTDQSAPPPPPPSGYQPVPNYGPPPVVYAQPGYAQPGYGQPAGYGQPQYGGFGQPQYGQPQGGGFLRSAMTTATGVAAGALAFEGIESLMHGFDHHAGYGSGFDGGYGGGGGRPEEIINNNYYGDASPDHKGGDLSDRFAAAGDTQSPDIEDRRDAQQGFADTSSDDNDDSATDNFADDSGDNYSDDSSFDDGGGSDFGGSDDGS